jgi:hypothetical protein
MWLYALSAVKGDVQAYAARTGATLWVAHVDGAPGVAAGRP